MRHVVATALLTLFTVSCSSESEPSAVTSVEIVETHTEDAANRLIEFSDAIRKRDYAKAGSYLAPDFRGRGYHIGHQKWASIEKRESLELDTTRIHRKYPPKFVAAQTGPKFLEDLEAMMAPYESMDRVFFKTRGAEFDAPGLRGELRMTAEIIGHAANGAMRALYGWATATVSRPHDKAPWQLARFELSRYQITTRNRPIFSEVAESAGLTHRSPRLGTPQNEKFYWRGAATADIDGDGRFDIFSSAPSRNFLYRNRGDGRFDDVTQSAGVGKPVGPTTPLFFDYDRDGDQDLFMAFVGWEDDGAPGGETLRLFQNDGKGKFTDVSKEVGLTDFRVCAFGSSVADFDGDGWLDLYVCVYHRLDVTYPDSWFAATNGLPNLLLRNDGGAKFVDVAEKAKVAGADWSYAAAFADFDQDGDQDLYVANDYGQNNLFINNGDGTFADEAAKRGVLDVGNGMGVAWGDLNNDGKLDLYVSNMSSSAGNRILKRLANDPDQSKGVVKTLFKLAAGNTIFHQKADGNFELLPPKRGGIGASWAWSAALFDIDLDGLLDIYVANGFISGDSLKDT